MKYLSLIRTIALLHQYQRPVKAVSHRGEVVEYVEVTLDDLALANLLAHEVLGRSLDELPPQTRRVLLMLDELVTEASAKEAIVRSDYRFTRRAVRERTGLSNTQLRVHLERLTELEYVLAHAGGRGQSVSYELVYDGQGKDGAPFLAGLIDLTKLGGHGYDGTRWSALARGVAGPREGLAGGWRPRNGRETGGGGVGPIAISRSKDSEKSAIAVRTLENADQGSGEARTPSYAQPSYVNGVIAGRP